MDIKPGTAVCVEIAKLPTNEAARKTIIRLCRRDPKVESHHRHQQAKRPSWEYWRRGGMQWHHQMKSKPAVSVRKGAKYTIRATPAVIRDLASVARFVKITPS
ncbi:MAG: hypothetical protein HZB38_06530 [Planctomycetes bacterium]|nr:hypothetical protein [Planctomycetota bacterium]